MKGKFLIIAGIVIFLLFVILFAVLNKEKKSPAQVTTTNPSSSTPNNYYWTQKNREASRKSYAVGNLIDKLPYRGSDFAMSYDINEDLFTVVLNSENLDAANKEFDNFLSQNGISGRDSISNLITKKEALRP